MGKPLGQILVEARVLTPQQLEEAIQAQVIFGGKLGTSLIELGYVNIATLSRFLSRKFGVPTIDHTRIKPVHKDTLKLFGKKLAVKFNAVPLALEGNRLDVLMIDPGNMDAEGEIGFATGKKVKTYVAPEIVVLTLMEKYFGVKRDIRYVQLSLRDTQAMRALHNKPAPGAAMDDATLVAAAKAPDRPKIAGIEPGKVQELSSQADFEKMMDVFQAKSDSNVGEAPQPELPKAPPPTAEPAQLRPATPPQPPRPQAPPPQAAQPPRAARPPSQTPQPPPPRAAPSIPPAQAQSAPPPPVDEEVVNLEDVVAEQGAWAAEERVEEEMEIIEELPEALSLAEAAQRLKTVENREELGQVVLAFALSYFKRAALFITRNGMAMGWDGMGGSIQRRAVQGVMLPLNAPSIFKTVHDSMSFFLGAIPKTPVNERFLKAMGDEKPRSVFLIPILFKGQVVNILYGDNGNNENAPTDISDLLILAPKVPMAFEELIVKKKKQLTG